MAEDADPESKTEDPSGKRLSEAAKKGNVAKSMEIGFWFTFLAATLVLWMLAEPLTRRVMAATLVFFERPHQIPVDGAHLINLAFDLMIEISMVMSPILGTFIIFSLAASLIQNPVNFSWEKVQPDISKLSLSNGLKRIISMNSVVEFVKNLIKIMIIGAILFGILMPELDSLETLIDLDVAVLLELCLKVILKLLGAMVGIMAVVAAADYAYQKYNYTKNLRMTRQEVKDEYKQDEGDPLVKAKLRQLRMQRVRGRMMAAVPKASVVVTNPTHYAVALQYDPDTSDAPTVVAKGTDLIARRIREIAKENNVPIVENPPLARALFKTELDDQIPFDHFRAVAEVISYVMRLKEGVDAKYEPKVVTVE
jgi:flagellar biosynthetic protein FlhB